MGDRKFLGAAKITAGWKIQFPVEAREHMNKKDKKKFKVGDRVILYVDADGRVTLERA